MLTALTVALAISALAAAGVYTGRWARMQGSLRTRKEACEVCGRRAPVLRVRYLQNTGMVIMFRFAQFTASACAECSLRVFTRMTGHTVVLGWWGTISFFVTPIFIVNNVAHALVTLTLPRQETLVRNALEDQREYALNLLATKDEATVVEVLARATGVPAAQVAAYVRSLR